MIMNRSIVACALAGLLWSGMCLAGSTTQPTASHAGERTVTLTNYTASSLTQKVRVIHRGGKVTVRLQVAANDAAGRFDHGLPDPGGDGAGW